MVNYHVVPDLTLKEIRQVKTIVIDLDITAKELVKQAILHYLAHIEMEIKRED